MQNCGENGAAERMCRRKLAGLSEPKWRFPAPQRGRKTGSGWAAVAKCQAESSGSGASAGTAVQPAEKAPASSAADMTDMDNPEYLGQLAATFAPGG